LVSFTPIATAQSQAVSAAQVITRIRKEFPMEDRPNGVDTFKAGDSTARVTGIAVTMMATLDVLQRAAKQGDNLVITHEPTFYSHRDTALMFEKENDAVYAAKQKFIGDHGMIIWRFHDAPHSVSPDVIKAGVARALGWSAYATKANPSVYVLPRTTLRNLASSASSRLAAGAVRISGDGSAVISKVVMTEGFSGFAAIRKLVQQANPDVVVFGEDHEWEAVEYVVDAITEGRIKGLVVLGHIPSEQSGMQDVAATLKRLVPEVPVHFTPTRDPFRPVR
jgi:putative NIF3 family GTP cyclohydrolase 1 type 2